MRSEPQPLSADEYSLWAMETRENQESGANACNHDTFGDDADLGWSFEENLAANERINIWTKYTSSTSPSAEVARQGRKSRIGCGDAKVEIEDEIQAMLAVSPVLRRFDFDGSVRQHLHAIRSVGGLAKVQEAMYLTHGATRDKKRHTVQKWPAYLLKLLKHFLRATQDGKHLTAPSPAVSTTASPFASPAMRASAEPAHSPFSETSTAASSGLGASEAARWLDMAIPEADRWPFSGESDADPPSTHAADELVHEPLLTYQ